MLLLRFLLISILLSPASAAAAMPVTHVFLAEKWLESHGSGYSDDERRQLTLFPDIRYLGELSRGETHERGVTVRDIAETEEPFLAGMRLHSFADEQRERLVVTWGIYGRLSRIPGGHHAMLLKFLEDEVLYPRRSWDYLQPHFTDIDPAEIERGASVWTVTWWHQLLAFYFRCGPAARLEQISSVGVDFLGVPAAVVEIWSDVVPEHTSEPWMEQYVADLVAAFVTMFAENLEYTTRGFP